MRPAKRPAAAPIPSGEPRPEDRKPRKQRLLKDDGRYIIFYDVGSEATDEGERG